VYLCALRGPLVMALRDGLTAFAGGSLMRFGLRTMLRRWRIFAGLLLLVALGVAILWLAV
jgi:hypothetical protein